MGTGFIQQRLHHLGLHSLFAEIFYLTTMRTPEELREKKKEVKESFEAFSRFLKSAELGLRIEGKRTQSGAAGIVSNLNEAVKYETAYFTIKTFLSQGSEAERIDSH